MTLKNSFIVENFESLEFHIADAFARAHHVRHFQPLGEHRIARAHGIDDGVMLAAGVIRVDDAAWERPYVVIDQFVRVAE